MGQTSVINGTGGDGGESNTQTTGKQDRHISTRNELVNNIIYLAQLRKQTSTNTDVHDNDTANTG